MFEDVSRRELADAGYVFYMFAWIIFDIVLMFPAIVQYFFNLQHPVNFVSLAFAELVIATLFNTNNAVRWWVHIPNALVLLSGVVLSATGLIILDSIRGIMILVTGYGLYASVVKYNQARMFVDSVEIDDDYIE